MTTETGINAEAIIRRIIQAAHRSLDLDDIFQAIADSVGESLQADRCFIARYHHSTNLLYPPTREYLSSGEIKTLLDGDPALWEQYEQFASDLCDVSGPLDTNHPPASMQDEVQDYLSRMGVRSSLSTMIRYNHECLAVLFIQQVRRSRHWRDVEKDIVRVATQQAGVAIHHALLHQDMEKEARRKGLSARLYKHALSGISIQKLFEEALSLAEQELGLEVGKVIEVLPSSEMRIRAVHGLAPELIGGKFSPGDEPHAGYSLEHCESVMVNNIYREKRFSPSSLHYQYGLVSGITAVIHGDGRPFGVLQMDSKTRRVFSESDRFFMEMVAHILGVIIERQLTIAEIRESKERFRRLVENVKDYAIFMEDSDGYISSWNQGAERIYGYTAEEAMGHHFSMLVPDELRDSHYCKKELAIAEREGRFEDEGWRLRRDGSLFWANVVVESLRDEQGRLTGFSSITRDMTERKRTERDLAESNRDLELFTAIASHDLKAPLRKARMFLGKILSEDNSLRKSGRDALERAYRSIADMQALVEDLLDWSRTSRAPLHPEPVNLREVMDRVTKTLRPLIREKKARVKVSDLPVLSADTVQMEQLFQNLVENGLKYQPEEAHTPEVQVYAEYPDERTCRIVVKDNGIGFAPEHASRIFEPFERLHARNGRYEGTGIGLAICHRIVERHGGNIQTESEPGKGSRFIVYLPFNRA